MIGRHERELCGYPFARLLSDEDQDRLERLMGQGSKWEAHRAVDFSIRRDGGDEVLLSISAGALGEGGMIVLTMRDVTEERRMAQRLAEAREKLIQSEKQGAMMEVAGAAAHELNQPLTSVMTSVAMLKRIQGDGEGPASRLIETMEQETERMASIIRRLSTITRYTTKSYVGEARIIDLEGASGGGADAGGEE